jgi:hypothetical protein
LLRELSTARKVSEFAHEIKERAGETKEGRDTIISQLAAHNSTAAVRHLEKMLEDMDNTRLSYIIDPDTAVRNFSRLFPILLVLLTDI